MHIGLIGGIGPAATELYYRGLVARHAGSARALELTIVHADVHELARNAAAGDARTQAQIFAGLVRRLAAAGAEAAAITSIAGHFCVNELAALSPIPILSAIPAIAERVRRQGLRTVGLLGTASVMTTRLYGGIGSASVVVPEGDALERAHQAYIAMALSGYATEEARAELFSIGQGLCREQGAEVVLLAGTDLFLAFDGRACGFPVIDCAEIHMDALHRASVGEAGSYSGF
jgi:aspartate racemase